jgi:hypothetical protein
MDSFSGLMSVLAPIHAAIDTPNVAASPTIHVVEGRDAIMKLCPLLVELSRRCGQVGAMDHLAFQFARPAYSGKNPCLVLISSGSAGGLSTSVDEVAGAVLLYEQRFKGIGTRVFSADYHGGERTVIAPLTLRPRIAFLAASALMKRGALLVQATYENQTLPVDTAGVASVTRRKLLWTACEREMTGYVPLKDNFEDTLLSLGKNTRHNLKRYRYRAETDLKQRLVKNPEMGREEFLALNRICAYPVTDAVAGWRYDQMKLFPKGALYLGLQTPAGEWISLIGGRTHEGSTVIDWQMNRIDMPSYWLSTVMRSYLLEHEVERGIRRIYFIAGTSHSIRNSMVRDKFVDLLVLRYKVPDFLLKRLMPPEGEEPNFLVRMMTDKTLTWRHW